MRRIVLGVAIALALLIGASIAAAYAFHLPEIARIFTSGAAKMQCTNVFVAGRDPALAFEQDFRRASSPGRYLALARPVVDRENRTVTATLFGFVPETAVYREGIGCTAALGRAPEELRAEGQGVATELPPGDPGVLWPEGEATLIDNPPEGVDAALLQTAIDRAFAESDPAQLVNTRGVLVVYRGRIIAERYANGFDMDTGHLSNSVAKSVTNALVGILVGQGRLDLYAPAPIAEWRAAGDPRGEITLDNLMRMSSGLQFEENYTRVWSDITRQFIDGDLAGYAASRTLEVPPGTRWQYSTGTSNILGRIVREAAGQDPSTAFAFPRRALFEPLGMRTAVLEVDTAGNFVGGSYFHASVRDYARLGLLYLRDGVWNGQRILPEGWVAYTTTLTPNGVTNRGYGAQFWLNTGGDGRRWPDLPEDLYVMNGHQGQHVFIAPSHDAVIVRVGLSEFDNWRMSDLAADVLAALPPQAPGRRP